MCFIVGGGVVEGSELQVLSLSSTDKCCNLLGRYVPEEFQMEDNTRCSCYVLIMAR